MLIEKRKEELYDLSMTATNEYDPFKDLELTEEEEQYINEINNNYNSSMKSMLEKILELQTKNK